MFMIFDIKDLPTFLPTYPLCMSVPFDLNSSFTGTGHYHRNQKLVFYMTLSYADQLTTMKSPA
jgi:hypothetical protein